MGKKPKNFGKSTGVVKMEPGKERTELRQGKFRQSSEDNDLKRRALWGWPADRWIAVAAIIVAICSLWVSIEAQRAARRDAHINMQPRLTYTYFYDEKGAGWKLMNGGLGTARLRGFRMLIDGKPVRDFIEIGKILELPQPVTFRFTNPMVGERYSS